MHFLFLFNLVGKCFTVSDFELSKVGGESLSRIRAILGRDGWPRRVSQIRKAHLA